jgi:MraZ protein
VFQGASALSLDAKGRMSVPSRYREALQGQAEGRVTLTKSPDGCLLLFPRPEWEIFRSRIAELPMDAIWVRRIYLGNAMDVELDSAGRVLVSPELRAAASLTKEVTLLGMGNVPGSVGHGDLLREGKSGNGARHARRAEEFYVLTRR